MARFRHDPVEDTPRFKRVEAEVDKKVEEAFVRLRLERARERVEGVREQVETAVAQAREDARLAHVADTWKEVLAEAKADLRYVEQTIRECDTETACSRLQEFGSIHTIWGLKQQILLEDYGIRWRPPSEMSPDINID